MTKDTGGPAFPCHPGVENSIYDGMTLRDYFAAKAMQAELISGVCLDEFPLHASRAYKMADAMLEARKA
jgi:hypothetical protein